MIIVEGPDGAGKSTLIEVIKTTFHLPVAPRVVSKDTQSMVDLVEWTTDNLAKGFQFEIYDRHRLISEPIYGSILRDHFEPGFDDPIWLHQMMFQLYGIVKPVIIYCLPPLEVVKANVKGDEDNKVVAPKIRRLWSAYLAKAVTDIALYDRAMYYDYTKPHTMNRVLVGILDVLKGTGYGTFSELDSRNQTAAGN